MSATPYRPLIGEVLVELGLIDRAKLALGLSAQRQGERLGEALLRLGFVDRVAIREALFEQYRRWFAGAVGLALLALQGGPAAAASSATVTLRLSLVVPARTSVSLVATPPEVVLTPRGGALARIAEESTGGSGYAVLLESANALRHGSPVLLGADGTTLPYSVIRGTESLRFTDGRAVIAANSGQRRQGAASELHLSLPPAAGIASSYADTLRLVVRPN